MYTFLFPQYLYVHICVVLYNKYDSQCISHSVGMEQYYNNVCTFTNAKVSSIISQTNGQYDPNSERM